MTRTDPAATAPKIGDTARFAKTMTVAEQAMFTAISGNLGPLYVDRRCATAAGLPDMAVFELAAASLLTTCLARVAGAGYRIAEFSAAFACPLAVGDTVEARATLREIGEGRLTFDLTLHAGGREVAAGSAALVPVAGETGDV